MNKLFLDKIQAEIHLEKAPPPPPMALRSPCKWIMGIFTVLKNVLTTTCYFPPRTLFRPNYYLFIFKSPEGGGGGAEGLIVGGPFVDPSLKKTPREGFEA